MSARIYPFPHDRWQTLERQSWDREHSRERELLRQVDALVFAYSPVVYAELADILAERKSR